MYEEYFGFAEKPFSLTPDPKYLFKSESHANAFELLQYAVRRREGFVVVTGDIGTGKTTLCRALLEQIDRNTFTALVLNPFLSEDDLLKQILQDFGVVSRDDVKRGRLNGVSKQELIETIYDFLLGLLPLHACAVLMIDEAQNLPMPVLEQIRILSNLETDKEKLLQVVLVGQLNLKTLLKAPQMRQLDQRVSIRYKLNPLTRDEVAAYVSHRLTIAGGRASVTFHQKALDLIHRRSEGIPRLINLLCDRALLAAYATRSNRVTDEMVLKAAENLELDEPKQARLGWFRRRASVMLAAAGASLLAMTIGLVAPVVLAATLTPRVTAPPVAAAAPREAAPVSTPPETGLAAAGALVQRSVLQQSMRRYSVLAASFPVEEIATEGSESNARLIAVIGQLRSLGYTPWLTDVDLKGRGSWRRVLVGEFDTIEEAIDQAKQLHAGKDFADAQPIKF